MIRHIVLWDLKDDVDFNLVLKLKEESEKLKSISYVKSLEFSVSPLKDDNYKMMLNATFDSLEDLDAYQVNHIHKEFGKKLKELVKSRVAFDYNI